MQVEIIHPNLIKCALMACLGLGSVAHAESWNKHFKGWESGCDMEGSDSLIYSVIEWSYPEDSAAKLAVKKKIKPEIKKYLVSTKPYPKDDGDSFNLNFKGVTYYGLPIKQVNVRSWQGESASHTLVLGAPLKMVKSTLAKNKVNFKKSAVSDSTGIAYKASLMPSPVNKGWTEVECGRE